jgi:hypothetical protein
MARLCQARFHSIMRIIHSSMVLLAFAGSVSTAPAQSAPSRLVDELITADRNFAARARTTNVVDALGAMFADDVVLSAYGAFHPGRDSAITRLNAVPENHTARIQWSPVRGGISGDGQHGFTYGFMTLTRPDSTTLPLKYVAYWVKKPEGWRVAVYRRVPRAPGDVPNAMREPSLPERAVAPGGDAAALARHAAELGDAERNFSALAGKIGLGPAFTQNAAPDAMNVGGGQNADFLYGPEAIGAGVGAGETGPSTLTWGPEKVLVASSGDLGVTIGFILPKPEPGQAQRRIPFFTIWKKVGGVWKFVAE